MIHVNTLAIGNESLNHSSGSFMFFHFCYWYNTQTICLGLTWNFANGLIMDVVFRNICFMQDDIHRVQMLFMLLVGSLYFLGTSSQVEWRKVQKEGFGNRENGVASKSFSHWVLTSWKSFFVKEVCKWMFWWLRHLALAMTLLSRKENFFGSMIMGHL